MRRGFWNWLSVFKFEHQEPSPISVPAESKNPPRLIPFEEKFGGIPVPSLLVADRIPRDEANPLRQKFTRVQRRLLRWISPMQSGLSQVADDAIAALDTAYTSSHRRCFRTPKRTPADLGELAVASPYAYLLEGKGPGQFRWDVSVMREVPCHGGVLQPGATVDFEAVSTGVLRPVRIETVLGVSSPGDHDWERSTRLAVSSISAYTSMVRHFNWLHLTCAGPLEAVTRMHLRADHPVRRLLWYHVYGTHYSNDLVTEVQMGPGGDFDSIFGLTHSGICELFEATTGDFDLAAINPVLDAARRGIGGDDIATPAIDSWTELYQVCHRHCARYLAVYYGSDDDVRADSQLADWVGWLDEVLPNGVGSVTGGERTLAAVAELTATIIYLATVEHEITGSGLWDYQLWTDLSPARLYRDGSRVPVDVYQRLVNANFNLNVHRARLLDDGMVAMALDDRGAQAFIDFQQDLLNVQARMDQLRPAPWRMEPRMLKANINA